MASTSRLYTRLPGRNWFSLTGRHSVYAAEDHVLSVWYRYFAEEYKRSYFRDIQALVIRETPRRMVLAAVLGVIAVLLFVAALAVSGPAGTGFFGGSALLMILLFAANLLRGPTCTMHVQTAVHREEIACVKRVPAARRLMAELRPRIEAAQGALRRADLQQRFTPQHPPAETTPDLPPIPVSQTTAGK